MNFPKKISDLQIAGAGNDAADGLVQMQIMTAGLLDRASQLGIGENAKVAAAALPPQIRIRVGEVDRVPAGVLQDGEGEGIHQTQVGRLIDGRRHDGSLEEDGVPMGGIRVVRGERVEESAEILLMTLVAVEVFLEQVGERGRDEAVMLAEIRLDADHAVGRTALRLARLKEAE